MLIRDKRRLPFVENTNIWGVSRRSSCSAHSDAGTGVWRLRQGTAGRREYDWLDNTNGGGSDVSDYRIRPFLMVLWVRMMMLFIEILNSISMNRRKLLVAVEQHRKAKFPEAIGEVRVTMKDSTEAEREALRSFMNVSSDLSQINMRITK